LGAAADGYNDTMYIGGGVIVVILVVLFVLFVLRR
jgi:hypothetical protein